MQRLWRCVVICILFAVPAIHPAAADNVIVGVNAYGANTQDMVNNGVKTLRIALFPNSVDFIIQAYQKGMGSVVIVYPFIGSTVKWTGGWSAAPLSKLDPQEFVDGTKPMFDKLEAAGVRLTAIELGNEINGGGDDGDIVNPGSGRILGLSDLNNPNDTEGRVIAAGYRNYVRITAALKDWRDHSKLNQNTPVITAGLMPLVPSRQGGLGVSTVDTIEFLRQNGMDKLVDGYGVHVYPDPDPRRPLAVRISALGHDLFAACTQLKPCWLTEWGIGNGDQSCPVNDAARKQVIATLRTAFKHFADQGKLAAVIWYAWVGLSTKDKTDIWAIYRCGVLTDAGKLALSPL